MLQGSDDDNKLSERVIGCAIEVHRELGPGLLESVYESALCLELTAAGIEFKRQNGIPLYYKGNAVIAFSVPPRLRGPWEKNQKSR